MAWFGESIANITGQISNFTKEVLAETPNEEDDDSGVRIKRGDSSSVALTEDLETSRKLVSELQAVISQHKNEIEHYKLLASSFEEKSEALDLQNQSLAESFKQFVDSKENEIKQLVKQIESSQAEKDSLEIVPAPAQQLLDETEFLEKIEEAKLEERAILQQRIEQLEKECEDWKGAVESLSNTKEVEDVETSCVEVQTEDYAAEEEAKDESYLRELEERCSAYQNDLYVLRGELMTLQADIDQTEEARARLDEEVLSILQSDFVIDGHSALSLPKHRSSYSSGVEDGQQLLLSALRQLASVLRGLNDKKNALERAVVSSTLTKSSFKEETGESQLQDDPTDEADGHLALDFHPQRLDSFGLETIEEEKNEEEQITKTDDEEVFTVSTEVPVAATAIETVDRWVQTAVNEEEVEERQKALEELKTTLVTQFQAELQGKEEQWRKEMEDKKSKILRLEAELGRLKNHLVDSEEQQTAEALAWEDKEKVLLGEIADLQRQVAQIVLQNERSKEVRDEISRLEADKELIRAQAKSYEEQAHKLGQQLQNLNFVLEQFQKEKEADQAASRHELQRELNILEAKNKSLKDELEAEKSVLEKARSGLDAARQLNLQIEEKTKVISSLKNQVQESEAELAKLRSQLDEVANNNVAKIDRYLVKNLVVGYFSTPPDKRTEVLRVIATVLDFNREDRLKTGLESGSFWPFSKSEGATTLDKKSLSEAFISFLEAESKPKAQFKIPMEDIAARKHSRTASESSNTSSAAGTSSTTTEISMNLPVLNQGDRSNSILKDVLNPKT